MSAEERLMQADVSALTDDERRCRWLVLEGRLEVADLQVSSLIEEMQAFARRCFEIDDCRATLARPQRYRIMGVLVAGAPS